MRELFAVVREVRLVGIAGQHQPMVFLQRGNQLRDRRVFGEDIDKGGDEFVERASQPSVFSSDVKVFLRADLAALESQFQFAAIKNEGEFRRRNRRVPLQLLQR